MMQAQDQMEQAEEMDMMPNEAPQKSTGLFGGIFGSSAPK